MGVVSIQRQGVSDVLFIGLSDGFISVHYIIMPSQFSSVQLLSCVDSLRPHVPQMEGLASQYPAPGRRGPRTQRPNE